MKRHLWLVIILVTSCKINPDSDRNYADRSKIYKLHLAPTAGSKYYYNVSNQSEILVEANNENAKSVNKSTAGISYEIKKDTSGNSLFSIHYDKLHIYTKKGDIETDADASNASTSIDPLEKMLGDLTGAEMSATVNSKGDIISITGYREIGNKIFSDLNFADQETKNIARQQWEKVVGDGIIKNNMNEMFRIFPDSAVHPGDTWKLSSNQSGFQVKNTYKLKTINNDLAIVESEGIISASDSSFSDLTGLANLPGEFQGDQAGEYEIESKTGMLLIAKIKATIKGTITLAGNEIPISVRTSVNIEGRRIK